MSSTEPTWGYRANGEARIFDLGPGEVLPDGWHASPDIIADPAHATAEALSAAAARSAAAEREESRLPVTGTAARPDPERAALVAENDRLRAENVRLSADVATLKGRLAQVEAQAVSEAEPLTASATDRPSTEPETAQPGQARSRQEARAAVRELLGEGLADREVARRVGVSPSTVAAVKKAMRSEGTALAETA